MKCCNALGKIVHFAIRRFRVRRSFVMEKMFSNLKVDKLIENYDSVVKFNPVGYQRNFERARYE